MLQGYGATVHLVGSTFISKQGITSSTFKTVPDVPVGTFELTLPEGPYSALAANTSLCKAKKLAMPTEFVGQNGALIKTSTKIAVSGCPKAKKVTKKKAHKRNEGQRNEGQRNEGQRNEGQRNEGQRNEGKRNEGKRNKSRLNKGRLEQGQAGQGQAATGKALPAWRAERVSEIPGALNGRVRMMARRRGQPGGRPPLRARARRADGPRGSSYARGQVDEIQRARVLGALREVVAETASPAATVAHIVARAGVSRRTFYELFADREECFLAAFDQAVALAAQRVVPPLRTCPAAGASASARRCSRCLPSSTRSPSSARCASCTRSVPGRTRSSAARASCAALAAAVEEGRERSAPGHEPAPLAAEGVVGAVLAVLHARLVAGTLGSASDARSPGR